MELLRPLLVSTKLNQGDLLVPQGSTVREVYFPTSVVISFAAVVQDGRFSEAATMGRDGVIGALPALDRRPTPSRVIVSVSGYTLSCHADAFASTVMESPSLLLAIIRHERTVYAQAQQNVACLSFHQIRQRLARALLRMRDLTGEDEIPITPEFLAQLLGVRHTEITEEVHRFERSGLVQYAREVIAITDVAGLKNESCECYHSVSSFYSSLLGPREL